MTSAACGVMVDRIGGRFPGPPILTPRKRPPASIFPKVFQKIPFSQVFDHWAGFSIRVGVSIFHELFRRCMPILIKLWADVLGFMA